MDISKYASIFCISGLLNIFGFYLNDFIVVQWLRYLAKKEREFTLGVPTVVSIVIIVAFNIPVMLLLHKLNVVNGICNVNSLDVIALLTTGCFMSGWLCFSVETIGFGKTYFSRKRDKSEDNDE